LRCLSGIKAPPLPTMPDTGSVHLLPRGGRFSGGERFTRGKHTASTPGPGQYDSLRGAAGAAGARGGKFSEANPKSDVDWLIYFAARQPGPGQYDVRDSRMIGVGATGGKFNESRPETDVERRMRLAQSMNPDGSTMGHSELNASGGRFNMSNPKTELDFMLERAGTQPGPGSYDAPRWPCPPPGAGADALGMALLSRGAAPVGISGASTSLRGVPPGVAGAAPQKLDRYRAEGGRHFPKQPPPLRKARSLSDVSVFNASVTAVQSNWLRPPALPRRTRRDPHNLLSVGPLSTGARVLMEISKFISQTKAKMSDCFHLFDKDGSGEIDAWELQDSLARLGLQLSEEEIVRAMQEIDENSDGKVSAQEFFDCIRRETIAQRARERSQSQGREQKAQRAAAAAAAAAGRSADDASSASVSASLEPQAVGEASHASDSSVAAHGSDDADQYKRRLAIQRPSSLQPTTLHSTAWGAGAAQRRRRQRARGAGDSMVTPPAQKFLRALQQKGEAFAAKWDRKSKQLQAAQTAARRLELADRRDDALNRSAVQRQSQLSVEQTLGTHFLSLRETAKVQPLPAPLPSLNLSYPANSRQASAATPNTYSMPPTELDGPSHAHGLESLHIHSSAAASSTVWGTRSRKSQMYHQAVAGEAATVSADLDAADNRIKSTGSEWSINSGPWPK
jgi:hypothetical protein